MHNRKKNTLSPPRQTVYLTRPSGTHFIPILPRLSYYAEFGRRSPESHTPHPTPFHASRKKSIPTFIDLSTSKRPSGDRLRWNLGNGRGAGPAKLMPSLSKRAPWHGHLKTCWSSYQMGWHPRWVHLADRA